MVAHLSFSGYLQPPSVPPDPIGDEWRGPQGFPGPPGPGGGLPPSLAASPSYDNDTQAAAGGVAVGIVYRNGNFVMIRVT